jgi:tripartite-type tricarboxylate transporter receptor subunit TctC
MIRRRTMLGLPAAAFCCAPMPAWARTYPGKPIEMIVPFAAGGSTEIMGRVFAEAMGRQLGQSVVLRVVPGAGGAIGTTDAAKSPPDGYHLMFTPAAALLYAALALDVPFGPGSFDYVAKITDFQQALVAAADAPFTTMQELIAYSKSHRVTYGSQGPETRAFIDYLARKAGVAWIGIPTGGGGEMVSLLLGGKIDFAYAGGIQQRYARQMKVLASLNAGPLARTPDAPAIADLHGVSMPSQAVIVVPKGTPPHITDILADAAEAAMRDPQFVSLMKDRLGFPLSFARGAALAGEIAAATRSLKTVLDKR